MTASGVDSEVVVTACGVSELKLRADSPLQFGKRRACMRASLCWRNNTCGGSHFVQNSSFACHRHHRKLLVVTAGHDGRCETSDGFLELAGPSESSRKASERSRKASERSRKASESSRKPPESSRTTSGSSQKDCLCSQTTSESSRNFSESSWTSSESSRTSSESSDDVRELSYNVRELATDVSCGVDGRCAIVFVWLYMFQVHLLSTFLVPFLLSGRQRL